MTFGLGALAHGSGFVAVYLYGLVLGDTPTCRRPDAVRSFGEQLASLAEIAMFVLLGVALAQVPLRHALFDAALLTLALVVVVRPLLVYPALRALRVRRRGRLRDGRRPQGRRAHPARGPAPAGAPRRFERVFALAGLVVLASLASRGRRLPGWRRASPD